MLIVNILIGQSYEMKNVISYRAKMTQKEMNIAMNRLMTLINDNGLTQSGYITTSTFSIEKVGSIEFIDIEILCPVDKICRLPQEYTFKPVFRLANAVKITHEGDPANLQATANLLISYINENKLTPITSMYNVTVREPKSPVDVDNMVVDMYIGVSDNIL
jgi:effector-binding domain-containing protein